MTYGGIFRRVGKSIDLGGVSDRVVIAVASAPVGNRTRQLLGEKSFRTLLPPIRGYA
jgi:hypothetical protein